ncbi:hypothetical protein [Falsiroseomonas sp. CW058]|uniref:hypothetical protein n=1 Tax=Falsiroseomonas sp. CW058 TaxID=3388664 RepID=UPI003D322106
MPNATPDAPALRGAFDEQDAEAPLVDRRVLAFRRAALVSAMENCGRVLGDMPPGAVLSAEPQPDRHQIRFVVQQDGTPLVRCVGGSRLAALLIAWCGLVRIPLPARAAKRIVVDEAGALLTFTTTLRRVPRVFHHDLRGR